MKRDPVAGCVGWRRQSLLHWFLPRCGVELFPAAKCAFLNSCGQYQHPPMIPCTPVPSSLVAVSGGIVLGADDQTTALFGATVNRLNYIDQLLLILENERQFVVVSGAQIAHDMFVAL